MAGCDGTGMAERNYPVSEVRGSGQEEPPRSKARGGGHEERPQVQGAVAAWVPEGLEELFHIQGREGRSGGDIPHPR